jgi:D-alanyl-D-alanine dipeptidase
MQLLMMRSVVRHHANARGDVLAGMRPERSQRMCWQGADEPAVEACGVSAANGQMHGRCMDVGDADVDADVDEEETRM